MKKLVIVLAASVFLAATAQATSVTVTATGQVYFNGINAPPLDGVNSGELVTMTFQVDSDNFFDGIPGDTRGYVIDQPSFSLSFSGGLNMGLMDPYPAGETPYFTLVEGFPVSDGFFVSNSAISPGGVTLAQDPINLDLYLGYDGDTLQTLDILDALGVYGYAGLTSFSFGLWAIFPDNVVMGIDFMLLEIMESGVSTTETSWGEVKAMFR